MSEIVAPAPAVPPPIPATPVVSSSEEQFVFKGSGSEYFRIWIVNLLLTILTLGIYSAWAKVRRLQYFYGNTELAGSSFRYEGDPVAILKGRFIALALFTAYHFSVRYSVSAFLAVLLVLALIAPWLLRNSFRFRLHNSSYRGMRFRFTGSNAQAYTTFLLYGPLAIFTLYLAAPLFHQRLKRYQHGNASFGKTPFAFNATVGQFYGAYAVVALLIVGLLVAFFTMMAPIFSMLAAKGTGHGLPSAEAAKIGSTIVLSILILYGGLLFIGPLWLTRIQNLVWNNTTLGTHQFKSSVRAGKLFFIFVTNLIGIVLTVGFFAPWAAVRLARYRAESCSLVVNGSLDGFMADQENEIGAAGQETAEFFDIDIGL